MKESVARNGLLKVGELARQADTSLSTVKFYVKEGLIRPVLKTGRNMAYYDPSCIETIQLIRTLQRERYYPLSVIKRLAPVGDAGAALPAGRHPQGGPGRLRRPLHRR